MLNYPICLPFIYFLFLNPLLQRKHDNIQIKHVHVSLIETQKVMNRCSENVQTDAWMKRGIKEIAVQTQNIFEITMVIYY